MTDPEVSNQDYGIDFERIKELISKYEEIKRSGEIKRYNEESTKKDFILPLFEALGWNVYNRKNRNDFISAEETISRKRVDYGFRINDIPKFFLEAKSIKEENIEDTYRYVSQAIDYAYNKACSWAILTNFETIAVYNADWKYSNYKNNVFFVLHPNDFLTDSRFLLLSKKAFENGEIDKEALKYNKKPRKKRIDDQLLSDMIHFREILSKDIVKNNQDKKLTQDDIDESVQRILDRLIFIRNAEDREMEENRLLSNVRQWSQKGKGNLIKEISNVYKYYDDQYNSKLFEHNKCDDLYIDNEALQEVIEGLNHSKDNSYRYDFSIIESDVLGNIYEQYLGNILKSTPKRAKLEESKTHKKEQGIYYTPSYVVDYIVKNTVGEYIKTHTPEEIKKVRILDPACGSGSFLIRAYKELENYWKQISDFTQLTLDNEEFYSKKVEILKNNIFGVDLDPKAVEITQLNLLLQISEKGEKLPLLQNNIKVGNSLIDDRSVSDKAFKWDEEFSEIIKEGGFDIIIGNPPYGDLLSEKQKQFVRGYSDSANEIAALFVDRFIDLISEGGILSYIITFAITFNKDLSSTRKKLGDNFETIKVYSFDRDKCRIFSTMTQSVSIMMCKNKKLNASGKFYTSKFLREQPDNFDDIDTQYANEMLLGDNFKKSSDLGKEHRLPKLGEKRTVSILNKLFQNQNNIDDLLKLELDKTIIWYRNSGNYWYNAWDKKPYDSSHIKEISVPKKYANFIILILNSSLFYLYLRVYGDGRDLNNDILKSFPVPTYKKIEGFSDKIDYMANKIMLALFANFDGEHNRFNTSKIKDIINECDKLLCDIYGLTNEEYNYIINYDSIIRNSSID